jgi:hypothetical protein
VTRLDASISIDRLDQSEDQTVEHERALKVPLPSMPGMNPNDQPNRM